MKKYFLFTTSLVFFTLIISGCSTKKVENSLLIGEWDMKGETWKFKNDGTYEYNNNQEGIAGMKYNGKYFWKGKKIHCTIGNESMKLIFNIKELSQNSLIGTMIGNSRNQEVKIEINAIRKMPN